ncbi:hypothetical protein RRF57_000903 [Xylaria bambusicola]|uniref:Uncharacterized protein n=1 Tax=Xylaria bambusicola TaxID=326684 RepID=A0AAN7Z061_9PEZI
MDPATIFQIVGTVLSLGDVVIRCITRLSALKAQFHDAPIIVTSMIGQLHMVKIAQDQLSTLNSPTFTHDPRYHQLAVHIGNALDSFSPILLALGQQLDRYEGIGANWMAAKTRMGFLNGEREMTNLSILLDRQVNALNLLLQAIQCATWTQQSEILTRVESQSILRLAQDCSSSLLGLEDVASFISEGTAAISTRFEFDDVLRSTVIYQAAERSHLRQAIRARRAKNIDTVSTDNVSQRSVTFGFRQAFRTMKLTKPIEECDALENQQGIRVEVDIHRETTVQNSGTNDTAQDGSQEASVNSSGGTNSGSTRPQPGLGNSGLSNWRRAFQRRTSSASDTKQKEQNAQPKSKVLLLGASGGGKTTLLNALQLYIDSESVKYEGGDLRTLVWHNALDSVRILLREMEESGSWSAEQSHDSAPAHLLRLCFDCERDPALNSEHATDVARGIASLRQNEEFQAAIKSRTAYQFHDNTEYYINNIDRLAEQAIRSSAPTYEDMLRTQVTTTGIHQTVLTYKDAQYFLYDVGGERSERKKWIHAFEGVSTVIYPVEVTGYRRTLREDKDADRMSEQFMIWESIVNSHWFAKSNFLIVFTKTDLLKGYLNEEGVCNFLRSKGIPTTVDKYLNYLESRFRKLIRWFGLTEQRLRFVYANLVDVETQHAVMGVMDVLEDFKKPWPSQTGTFTAVNRELFVKSPVSRDSVDSSSENSSVVIGRLSVGGNEDTNALLFGMAP